MAKNNSNVGVEYIRQRAAVNPIGRERRR